MDGNRAAAKKINHGLVNRESRIRIDDLIALFYKRKHGEEDDWFPAGNHDHLLRRDPHVARLAHVLCDGRAQFRQPCRGTVVCPSSLKSLYTRLDDVAGRIEIGLPNLEMDNVFTLSFESASANQDLESSFRPKTLHPLREFQRMCCGPS